MPSSVPQPPLSSLLSTPNRAAGLAGLLALLFRPCADQPPCDQYYWSYGPWVCNNTAGCGGGTAYRESACLSGATHASVDASYCDASALQGTVQPCAQAACAAYYWKPLPLSACGPLSPEEPCGTVGRTCGAK